MLGNRAIVDGNWTPSTAATRSTTREGLEHEADPVAAKSMLTPLRAWTADCPKVGVGVGEGTRTLTPRAPAAGWFLVAA